MTKQDKTVSINHCFDSIKNLQINLHKLSYEFAHEDIDKQIATAEELQKHLTSLNSLKNLLKILK